HGRWQPGRQGLRGCLRPPDRGAGGQRQRRHLQPTGQGAEMELNRPRPVRRLDRDPVRLPDPGTGVAPAPAPPPTPQEINGNGHHASSFVSAPRKVKPSAFAFDRMQIEDLSVFYGAKEAVK